MKQRSKMMLAAVMKPALMVLFAMSLSACTTVKYGDATDVETVNVAFGSTDLQQTAKKMVGSFLTFPGVAEITSNGRPVMFVDAIKNKTSEHIDMESITDTISTQLLQSGKFRFVDPSRVEAVMKQLDYQKNSGLVDQNKAVNVGRQVGARYMMYGNLSSIVKREGRMKDVYYKFTMKLIDLETGLLEWQEEKEIRKQRKKGLLGL